MMTENVSTHLNDLLGYSIGRWKKLIAAWDALNVETQILILHKITAESDYYNEFKDEFFIKAFKSKNDYIRYLVAKWLVESREEEIKKSGLWEVIENDPCDLVKNCKYESDFITRVRIAENIWSNIQNFWTLPKDARLAWARGIESCDGYELKLIVESVVSLEVRNHDREYELIEILREVACHLFRSPNYHHWGEWDKEEPDFRLLRFWEIVPLLKDIQTRFIKEYLENIPYIPPYPYGYGIDETIEKCAESHLKYLLYRPELKLKEFRKKLYFDENTSDDRKSAATLGGLIDYDEYGAEITEEELSENCQIESKLLALKEELLNVPNRIIETLKIPFIYIAITILIIVIFK